jgi:hypothetical protein
MRALRLMAILAARPKRMAAFLGTTDLAEALKKAV